MNAKTRYAARCKDLADARRNIPLYGLNLTHDSGCILCLNAASPQDAHRLLAEMRQDAAWTDAAAALSMRCPNCGGLGFNEGGKPGAADIPCGWCQASGWIPVEF